MPKGGFTHGQTPHRKHYDHNHGKYQGYGGRQHGHRRSTIIPLSRVCFGFVAGGGEYSVEGGKHPMQTEEELPFAGGTGAGVTVHPMGFLVVGQGQVKLLPAQYYAPVDRIIELVPQLMTEIKNGLDKLKCDKQPQPAPPPPAE